MTERRSNRLASQAALATMMVCLAGCCVPSDRLHWSVTPYASYQVNEGMGDAGLVGISITVHDGTPAPPAVPRVYRSEVSVAIASPVSVAQSQSQGQEQGQEQDQKLDGNGNGNGNGK